MQTVKQKETYVCIDPELLKQIQASTDNCTIVHCIYGNPLHEYQGVRIWPTTYLVQEDGIRKKLVQAYNIPPYPQWKYFGGSTCSFTLLFEGLEKDCKQFDLLEDIPESGEFFVPGIKRNETDVYLVKLT